MSGGGLPLRCCCPAEPGSSVTGAPLRGPRFPPVLADLFLRYAFGAWLAREYPAVQFERYAGDAIVHGVTRRQAPEVLAAATAFAPARVTCWLPWQESWC
jgi:hypothetical protein